jgi:hypothetical protein
VRNLATVGKKKVTTVEETVESDLVYPLIRGQDVRMWYGKPSAYMVVPSDASGCILPPSNLRVNYPGAWAYFNPLFDDLIHRNGEPYKSKLELYRKGKSQDAELLAPPFYWLFNLTAALKAYKVVWKEIAGKISGKGRFSVAVIPPCEDKWLGRRIVVPDHKLMLLPFDDADEAYFVAAILNFPAIRLVVAGYTIETAISTHVVKHVKVITFDPTNVIHGELSRLSRRIHDLAANNADVRPLENEVNQRVAHLYGLKADEVKECVDSLSILESNSGEVETED